MEIAKPLRAWFAVVRAVSGALLARPWTALVALAGVSLGVAVVVAIDVASLSAEREHARTLRLAAAGASHRLLGGAAGVPESLYAQAVTKTEVEAAAATVTREITLPAFDSRRVSWRGLDLLSELGWNAALSSLSRGDLLRLMESRHVTLIGAALARELGVTTGDTLQAETATGEWQVEIIGLVETDSSLGFALIADIATVQAAAGQPGRVDGIDLRLNADADVAALEREFTTAGARLVAIDRDIEQQQSLSRAFKTNLRMMGLLALLVGLLLVYNAQSFSVVQRRQQLGVLRALGVARRDLGLAILFEAAVLGCLAAAVGLGFGVGIATLLLGAVEQTLNDLYYSVRINEVSVSAALVAKAFLLSIVGSMASAIAPAVEASVAPPATALRRSTVETRARHNQSWLLAVSALLVVSTPLVLSIPGGGLLAGYLALFAIVAAAALLVPGLWFWLLDKVVQVLRRGAFAHLAVAVTTMRASASRSAVAVAALTVALAATIGVDTMIGSFRASVTDWLQQTLRADIYVSEPGAGPRAKLTQALLDEVGALPGVAGFSEGRSARVQARGGRIALVALDLAPQGRAGFKLLDDADRAATWRAFDEGAVLISETFAYKRGLEAGSTIELLVTSGWQAFDIAAVYRDYSTENGVVLMSGETYRAAWGDEGASSLGVYLDVGAPVEQTLSAVETAAAGYGVLARRTASLREQSLRIFDRTFVVTEVLRSVTIVVAFAGVLSVLLALQLDRAREVALLRASGSTRLDVGLNVIQQTLLLGAAAGLFAMPLGALVGYLLVDVINTRSFGWTLDFIWQPLVAAEALALSLTAALIAGIYPALKLARAPVAAGLRYE